MLDLIVHLYTHAMCALEKVKYTLKLLFHGNAPAGLHSILPPLENAFLMKMLVLSVLHRHLKMQEASTTSMLRPKDLLL
jgi:hypothetical protein